MCKFEKCHYHLQIKEFVQFWNIWKVSLIIIYLLDAIPSVLDNSVNLKTAITELFIYLRRSIIGVGGHHWRWTHCHKIKKALISSAAWTGEIATRELYQILAASLFRKFCARFGLHSFTKVQEKNNIYY